MEWLSEPDLSNFLQGSSMRSHLMFQIDYDLASKRGDSAGNGYLHRSAPPDAF